MPHREAAMMGLPVIATRFSGLDDGHTHEWALVVEKMYEDKIGSIHELVAGTWVKADIGELAKLMRWCYENPEKAAEKGKKAAKWLRENQTWEQSADKLLSLIERVA
jgi:glycosyltransferase involved in cell wall biosynthesis